MSPPKNQIFLALNAIFLIVSRWIFRAHYLYEWDSVQYALSLKEFNILWHQPHPPGYILYVIALKVTALFCQDPNQVIILTNIGFSLLAVVFFYKLATLLFEDNTIAQFATLWLVLNPIFWFNGSTATIYTAEAFISTCLAYILWKSKSGNTRLFLVSTALLGLLGGFRQTSTLLLLPLWFYVLWLTERRWKFWLLHGVCFIAFTLVWLVPTILNTGGLQSYMAISRGLVGSGSEKLVIFFGSQLNYLRTSLSNYIVWLAQGLSPVGILLVASTPFVYRMQRERLPFFRNRRAVFLLLWALPSMFFYLIYLEKPGYLLTSIPPLLLISAWTVHKLAARLPRDVEKRIFQLVFYLGISLSFFFWFVIPSANQGIPEKIQPASYIQTPPLSDYNWDVSAREIAHQDYQLGTVIQYFQRSGKYRPQNSIILYAGGAPSWRHLMYYLPEYKIYWLVDSSVSGMPAFGIEYYYAQDYRVSSHSGEPFWIQGSHAAEITLELDKNVEFIIAVIKNDNQIFQELAKINQAELLNLSPDGQRLVIVPNLMDEQDLGSFRLRK